MNSYEEEILNNLESLETREEKLQYIVDMLSLEYDEGFDRGHDQCMYDMGFEKVEILWN